MRINSVWSIKLTFYNKLTLNPRLPPGFEVQKLQLGIQDTLTSNLDDALLLLHYSGFCQSQRRVSVLLFIPLLLANLLSMLFCFCFLFLWWKMLIWETMEEKYKNSKTVAEECRNDISPRSGQILLCCRWIATVFTSKLVWLQTIPNICNHI